MKATEIIQSFGDLLKAAVIAEKKFNKSPWYRGHSSTSPNWKLRPSVFRSQTLANNESELMTQFVLHAHARREKCPEKNTDWLSLMCHHGLPTRLLDWTESILIACYFAICEEKGESATIWALNPIQLSKSQVDEQAEYAMGHIRILSIANAIHSRDNQPRPTLPVFPPHIDLRMMVQQSRFTIHGSPTPLEELDGHSEFLVKFDIPADIHKPLKNDLNRIGIHMGSLFPDLDHLALQRTLFVWRRSTGAQGVDADAELFQSVCGCLGMATARGCVAYLMVLDDLHRVLQAAPARRVRQGQSLDQRVHGSVDLVPRDLRIFPPAAGSSDVPETSGSLE